MRKKNPLKQCKRAPHDKFTEHDDEILSDVSSDMK